MKYCSKCQNSFDDFIDVCPNDGAALSEFDVNNLVGQTIDGKYKVESLLGMGGMGAVFRARHTFINNEVAIKVILPKMAMSEDVVERFLREARAAAMIDHPNAIKVTDFGKASGVLYLVMEFIQGYSLTSVIRKNGYLQPTLTANIMSQVCAALDAAHSHNIIHRDLKPDNIMIKQNDLGQLVIKVLDFGIAKIKTPEESSTSLTREGSIIGTLNYMSPEQCRGEELLDSRSDIYSLGVVVFEMLTGTLPFTAPTPTGVAVKHIVDPPPALRSIVPSIPEQIDRAVLRALEKEPGARYKRAGEFAAELVNAARHSDSTQRLSAPGLFDEPAKGGTRALSDEMLGDLGGDNTFNLPASLPSSATSDYHKVTTETVDSVNTTVSTQKTKTGETVIRTGEHEGPVIPSPVKRRATLFVGLAVALVVLLGGGYLAISKLGQKGPAPPGSQKIDPALPGMVLIKGGWMKMGTLDGYEDERPMHDVYVDSFYLDETEVTNEQFEKFANETSHITVAEKEGSDLDWRTYNTSGRKNHPVVQIAWDDAVAYAKWAGKRLPTEAEWEYAARGGMVGKRYPWGDEAPQDRAVFGLVDQVMGDNLIDIPTQPAKSKQPNGYGLYNMAGNAWEWCQDFYDPSYFTKSPPKNPTGPSEGQTRVLRGGSWYTDFNQIRVSKRNSDVQTGYQYDFGFRCAKSK
jgi:eukaryotic-like serine/threonine-protein kinase